MGNVGRIVYNVNMKTNSTHTETINGKEFRVSVLADDPQTSAANARKRTLGPVKEAHFITDVHKPLLSSSREENPGLVSIEIMMSAKARCF